MSWLRWAVMVLALTEAGWMAFDGARALVVSNYVTPLSGPYAGQLGPWARVVERAGVGPRSTLMKSIFAAYGAAWLLLLGCFAARLRWAGGAMLGAAAGALWYLPFGTLCSLVQIGMLLFPAVRSPRG